MLFREDVRMALCVCREHFFGKSVLLFDVERKEELDRFRATKVSMFEKCPEIPPRSFELFESFSRQRCLVGLHSLL